MQDFKELAYQSFYKGNYDIALLNFSLALKANPDDFDTKVGAILSDYAQEDTFDAISLLDYYQSGVTLGEDKKDLYNMIISSIDYENDLIYELADSIENVLDTIENGVEYNDFIKIANLRGNIKQSLEDVMFSSKIIINSRDDIVNFIELLMKNDFEEEALSYLESAIKIYPRDGYLQDRFKQLSLTTNNK